MEARLPAEGGGRRADRGGWGRGWVPWRRVEAWVGAVAERGGLGVAGWPVGREARVEHLVGLVAVGGGGQLLAVVMPEAKEVSQTGRA